MGPRTKRPVDPAVVVAFGAQAALDRLALVPGIAVEGLRGRGVVDRAVAVRGRRIGIDRASRRFAVGFGPPVTIVVDQLVDDCLLYTSDAADERSSVDLGGRRIIKKKKKRQQRAETSL